MYFSLCIPTMNRFDKFLSKSLPLYISNIHINEIIICDENGNDFDKILTSDFMCSKLKLYKNKSQLGPFLNKINCCSKAINEWIVLIDSDNFADYNYFNVAISYIDNNNNITKNSILSPSRATPRFDFTHLSNLIITKNNLKKISINQKNIIKNRTNMDVLMNTGNYIINKYLIDNINLSMEKKNIEYSSACDVIYFNTLLFEQLDLQFHVLSDLEYQHTVHSESIYILTCNKFKNFNNSIYNRFNNLM